MSLIKRYTAIFLGFLGLFLVSGSASAATSTPTLADYFKILTDTISFSDLISALATVYSGLIVVGLFLMGSRIIMKKLAM